MKSVIDRTFERAQQRHGLISSTDVMGFADKLPPEAKQWFLGEVKQQMWKWFNANSERVLIQRKVLWITVSLKVKNLRAVFVELFDEEPAPA